MCNSLLERIKLVIVELNSHATQPQAKVVAILIPVCQKKKGKVKVTHLPLQGPKNHIGKSSFVVGWYCVMWISLTLLRYPGGSLQCGATKRMNTK